MLEGCTHLYLGWTYEKDEAAGELAGLSEILHNEKHQHSNRTQGGGHPALAKTLTGRNAAAGRCF